MVAVFTLSLLAESLAQHIPFSAERDLVALHEVSRQDDSEINRYLQQVTNSVAQAQVLPEEMAITIHYLDDETVNAFATLGGHIFLYRGLLEKLPHENALAMLIAHEVAHIKHRHPIKGMGRAVVIGVALSMVNGSVGNEVVGQVLGEAGLMTVLKFSRDQELEADTEALETINRLYGHSGGGADLFELLQTSSEESGMEPYEIFSTHPLVAERIRRVPDVVAGTVVPLPDQFSEWLGGEAEETE